MTAADDMLADLRDLRAAELRRALWVAADPLSARACAALGLASAAVAQPARVAAEARAARDRAAPVVLVDAVDDALAEYLTREAPGAELVAWRAPPTAASLAGMLGYVPHGSDWDDDEREVRVLALCDWTAGHAVTLAEAQARQAAEGAQVLSLADVLSAPPMRWAVGGLVPAGSVGFLVAAPNTGKSVLAVDWIMRGATGVETWHGHRIRAGSSIYVLGEGSAGFGRRIAAWLAHHPAARPQHHVSVVRRLPPLSSAQGLLELRTIAAEHARQHGAPTLVVVDTLASLWAESEDRSEHAGPCMAALGDLASEHGCGVLLLHHPRKPQPGSSTDAWAMLRGSGAWAGAADYVLHLAEREGSIVLTTPKQRDADRAPPVPLRVLAVDLGEADEDGQPTTGPVLVGAAPQERADDEPDALAAQEADVAAVVEALAAHGRTSPVDRLAALARLPRARARLAVRIGVGDGRIVVGGATRDRWYDVPGREDPTASGANRPDPPQKTPSGTPSFAPVSARADTPHTPLAYGGANGGAAMRQIPAERRESARIGANGANGANDATAGAP